jgi:hypothetical protein
MKKKGIPMLKKSVCQKCFQENHATWQKSDEQCWRNRHDIICPVDHFKHDEISTNGEPPEWCKYMADHGKQEHDEIAAKKQEISIEIDDIETDIIEHESPTEDRSEVEAFGDTG